MISTILRFTNPFDKEWNKSQAWRFGKFVFCKKDSTTNKSVRVFFQDFSSSFLWYVPSRYGTKRYLDRMQNLNHTYFIEDCVMELLLQWNIVLISMWISHIRILKKWVMETKICQFLCTHQNYAYIYASGGALKKRYGLYDLFYNCAFLQVNHAIIDTCQPRLCFIYYKIFIFCNVSIR